MNDPIILWLGGLGLGALMLASALHKLRDLRQFSGAVTGYNIVPAVLVPLAAPLLAMAELAAGLAALMVPFVASVGKTGMIASAAILMLYATVIAFNIARGNTAIDCGCFGFGARGPGLRRGMIVRNIAFAALALPAVVEAASREFVWLDAITLLGGLIVLGLVYAGGELSLALPTKETAA
ncbi:hypothetical protein GGQ88_002584 [Novosphingobium hassiacum]|uniref:Methylamine utilization protein MauE n=1 Tax=Novosphingobium hassiacum TaxID=173676 RepID=A0A7W6A117_9SPHN|nr:MauE/DoxX family redox-associated membrane protein [Novosphingobium hassiacum]MBB3861300.1 hypothetical protein [Novosphingobium hassiacum]